MGNASASKHQQRKYLVGPHARHHSGGHPVKTFDPYLGDYDHMLAVGRDFYGIFSASNVPDMAHFPNGVTFQRNVDFDTRVLLDVNNQHSVPPSIDPFFFKVSG